MEFLNRNEEMSRLESLFSGTSGSMAALWGRRRQGKTRVLLEWCRRHNGVYTVADQSSAKIQRKVMAIALQDAFPEFAKVEFPDWQSLLEFISAESHRRGWRGPCIFDEFPYLVEQTPELPSIMQRWIDHEVTQSGLIVAIAGSNQRMMQGIVLDAGAPLYGRARELMRIEQLKPHFIQKAFNGASVLENLERYLCLGGTPYYWELAQQHNAPIDQLVDYLILNPLGPLHNEPEKLIMENAPSHIMVRQVLDAIGFGAHRISEIAARVGKPATTLSKVLHMLVELGLIERQIPFGESEKSSKKSLYQITDPFFHLWFQVVGPRKSFLTKAPSDARIALWCEQKDRVLAHSWESLCRDSVPFFSPHHTDSLFATQWSVASRYWSPNSPEWDIVAESLDGSALLLGEVKWSRAAIKKSNLEQWTHQLIAKGVPCGRHSYSLVHHVLFVPSPIPEGMQEVNGVQIISGEHILQAMR
ncbi:MAG: ATP-binding protein [Chitinispirillaceae bacterium]|nr:ATP-binding protein [Chitinispirillaceae bacterium]